MQRVAVVGSGGAGKTTFARELADRTGLPVVSLDRLFWKLGWVETPPEEWAEVQRHLVSQERWILDGNYGGTMDIRLERADTVVFLDLPRTKCVAAAASRSWRHRNTAIQAEGCPERFEAEFLRWIWRFPRNSRPRLEAAIARHEGHLEVIRLRSRQEMRAFLERIPVFAGAAVTPRGDAPAS